jgi:hypothetical protein
MTQSQCSVDGSKGVDGAYHTNAVPAPVVLIALYLNRCPDGCTVTAGADDARADTSSVAAGTLTKLPRLDLAWAQLVICVRDRVAPYDVQVVTEEPVDGEYVEVMIAGLPSEVGVADVEGIAPRACEAQSYGLAFAFGNRYDLLAEPERALDLCWTVAREAGHLWGLDDVADCHDVMGPRDCDASPWFTRAPLASADSCREIQDAHALLVERLGAGVDAGPPLVEIERSAFAVTSARAIARVEVDGEPVELDDDGRYTGLPAGPVQVRAFDDLGRMGGADGVIDDAGGCSTGGTGGAVLAALALLSLPCRRRA